MPDKSGYEVYLRSSADKTNLADLPVLLISGIVNDEGVQTGGVLQQGRRCVEEAVSGSSLKDRVLDLAPTKRPHKPAPVAEPIHIRCGASGHG